MIVKKSNRVKVFYTGYLDDGTILGENHDLNNPIEFVVGAGRVIRGFEDAVIGMKPGEGRRFRVDPSNAFGGHNPALIRRIPKNSITGQEPPQASSKLQITMRDGHKLNARIVQIANDEAIVDFNHPLAGKSLLFKVRLVKIVAS